jgi:hypothetical protein
MIRHEAWQFVVSEDASLSDVAWAPNYARNSKPPHLLEEAHP